MPEISTALGDPDWDTMPHQPDGNAPSYADLLLELRNKLAHGNDSQLTVLRREGVLDTMSWTRDKLPMLNRTAKALDTVLWDRLVRLTGVEPWG